MKDETVLQDRQYLLKNLQSNVWKFYVYKALWGLGIGLFVPTVVLFYLGRGISLSEFMILLSVMNVSIFVFEVPTGIVADKFSRKWSVCSGTVLYLGSVPLASAITVYYPLLVLGFLLGGIGESLVSGADSALLYDSLKAIKKEDKFQKVIGNAISLQLSAMVVGTICCGAIVEYTGLAGPIWVTVGAAFLTTVVTSQFTEPPFRQEMQADEKSASFRTKASSYVTHLKASFKFVVQSRELIALIFISMIIIRLCFLIERPFAQPYLSSFGYNPEQISYFHTIFYGITALFAKNSHRVAKMLRGSERSSMLLVGLVGIASLSFMVNAWLGSIVVTAMVGTYVMKGLFEPLIQNSLNCRMTSEKRASCLSLAKMGNNFLGIFLGPLFGYWADMYSLKSSLLIFQWTFIPLIVVGIIWGWKALGRTSEIEAGAKSFVH